MWPDWLTEARLALIIAIASASLTGWQAWSGYITARAATAAQRRKDPVFEIDSSVHEQDPAWVHIGITARNIEPVAVRISGYEYRGRDVLLVNPDALQKDDADPFFHRRLILDESKGFRTLKLSDSIGPGGLQTPISKAPHVSQPTKYFRLLARGPFERSKFTVLWEWADGVRR